MAARPDRCLGNFPLLPFNATRPSSVPSPSQLASSRSRQRLYPRRAVPAERLRRALPSPPPLHHTVRRTKSQIAARRRIALALASSGLFTMAIRYSHYPRCTSPSDRLHRGDWCGGGGGGDDDSDNDCERNGSRHEINPRLLHIKNFQFFLLLRRRITGNLYFNFLAIYFFPFYRAEEGYMVRYGEMKISRCDFSFKMKNTLNDQRDLWWK